ncbi:MAG: ABC transporter permease [Ferruginibacter sp.]
MKASNEHINKTSKAPAINRSRQFYSFVRKEFYHIWRDKRTLLILFGMPLAQIIIFGFALTNEVKNTKIAVFDQSRDEVTTSIIARIDASAYFQVAKEVHQYNEAEQLFKEGKIKMIIVFPTNFGKDLTHLNKAGIQFITDATDPNVATTINNYASAVILDYQAEVNRLQKMPYQINTEVRMLYNPELKGAYTFVPGVMAMILMLVCSMMTSIAIVKERETGTMEIILVSPLNPIGVILAKVVPYLILSMINVISILLLSVYVLDVPVRGNIALLLTEAFLFTITCLALGLLISSVAKTQQVAMLISLMGLFLPTIMFSGFMFPIENMPKPMQVITNAVPAKWFYIIIRSVMIKGLGFASIWKETLILMGMTVFFLLVSIKKFKIRLA